MRRTLGLLVLSGLLVLILSGCAQRGDPADAVKSYFQALVSKKIEELPKLVCKEWEKDARTEFDSFGAVEATVEGLDCKQSETSGDYTLVTCQGKIVVDYRGEKRDLLNLPEHTYQVKVQDGEWRMCGYQ